MQATQAKQATKYGFTVTEAEAAIARKAHDERKAASKAALKYAEALRLDRQADIERNRKEAAEAAAKAEAEVSTGAVVESTPVVPSKMGVIVSMPTHEELDRRAADILRNKREQAEIAKQRILKWMRDAIPSREMIEREFAAALFVPMDGDDETAYRCEGVVIHTDEVDRVRVREAWDAKRRVLEVLRGTDVTAKLAALEAEGFEFSHEDRGNKVYTHRDATSVEVTLFINQRRDFVATESTPRPKKLRGSELICKSPDVSDEEREMLREKNRRAHEEREAERKAANKRRAEEQLAKKEKGYKVMPTKVKTEKKPDDGKKNKRKG